MGNSEFCKKKVKWSKLCREVPARLLGSSQEKISVLPLTVSFWGPTQERGHWKATFSWSPGTPWRQRSWTSFAPGRKKKGRNEPRAGYTELPTTNLPWR